MKELKELEFKYCVRENTNITNILTFSGNIIKYGSCKTEIK